MHALAADDRLIAACGDHAVRVWAACTDADADAGNTARFDMRGRRALLSHAGPVTSLALAEGG